MCTERYLRLVAGMVVLLSVVMGVLVSQYWFVLTGLVAVNLVQSAFTNWCPAKALLEKLGTKSDPACNPNH
jgi:hypothetical protein